jgi:SpoVK/Ycf46/Vps4 family AAA+-type ATPase
VEKVASVDGTTLLSSMTKQQWAVLPNDTFTAIGTTVSHLPPAIYTLTSDGNVIFFNKTKVLTDNLIELDDSAALKVIQKELIFARHNKLIIAGIEKFWESKDKFDNFGILFKRGILMWGPAGSGKTATVNMLMNDLVKRGGMVVIVQSPAVAIKGLHELRRIEPDRPIIIVLEDIEEIINNCGEHGLLGLLDGEHQVSNVVVLATTNYPEQLGERIINRPSRFDEVILVDMPSARARYRYLKHILVDTVPEEELQQWVAATEKLSIAHLRELIVATQCLGRPYSEVVDRLKRMKIRPNSEKRGKGELGFDSGPVVAMAACMSGAGRSDGCSCTRWSCRASRSASCSCASWWPSHTRSAYGAESKGTERPAHGAPAAVWGTLAPPRWA